MKTYKLQVGLLIIFPQKWTNRM